MSASKVILLIHIVLTFNFFIVLVSGWQGPGKNCKRSVAVVASDSDFKVCVRTKSASAIFVTWSPSESRQPTNIEKWLLAITENPERRKVVTFLSLELTVSRFVVRNLKADTRYYIFLDSLDDDDFYVTKMAVPISLKTPRRMKNVEKSVKKVKAARSLGIVQGDGKQHGTNGEERRAGNKSIEEDVKKVKYAGGKRPLEEIEENRRDESGGKNKDNEDGSEARVFRTKENEQQEETKSDTLRHRNNINGKIASIEKEEFDLKMVASTLIPHVSEVSRLSDNDMDLIPTVDKVALPHTTTPQSKMSTQDASSKAKDITTSDIERKVESDEHIADKLGRGFLWWVGISLAAGLVLILILSLCTLLVSQRGNKQDIPCAHLEQELLESGRTGNKLDNNLETTPEIIVNSSRTSTSNRPKMRKTSAENGYTRPPSLNYPCRHKSQTKIQEESDTRGLCDCSQRHGRGTAEASGIYESVNDVFMVDPSRIASMISWGSEFDLIGEREETVYGNLNDNNVSTNETVSYNNTETIYSNMGTMSHPGTLLQPPPSIPPRLTNWHNNASSSDRKPNQQLSQSDVVNPSYTPSSPLHSPTSVNVPSSPTTLNPQQKQELQLKLLNYMGVDSGAPA